MLPRKELNEIKIQMNNGLLGVAQYEFICLRLIDSIKQLEEEKEKLNKEIADREDSHINLYNDHKQVIRENKQLKEALEYVANHNIFAFAQIEIKDYARKVLASIYEANNPM